VVQLIKALRYKPQGRGFNSQWGQWDFFIDLALVDSTSSTKPGISPGVKGGRCLSRPVIEFIYLLLHATWAHSFVSADFQDLHPKMLLLLISLFVLHACTDSFPLI
jgi:hypothetical protein